MSEYEVREIVYIGRRFVQGRIVYGVWIDGETTYWKKRPYRIPSYAGVGSVWAITFTGTADGEFFSGGEHGPRFLRLFPDAEYRAGWEAEDRAAEARLDNAKDAKTAEGGISELCAPLRRVYSKATPFDRAALLVRIIAEVQKGA